MRSCYDYMHLLTCDNLEDDVWRVVILLAVVIAIVGVMSWLVVRVMKRMGLFE